MTSFFFPFPPLRSLVPGYLLQITTPFLLKNTTAYKLRQVLHYYERIIRNDESYYKLNTNLADLLMLLGMQQLSCIRISNYD